MAAQGNRKADIAPAAIRADLKDANVAEAAHTVTAAVLSSLAHVRRHPVSQAQSMFIHAAVTGRMAGLAQLLLNGLTVDAPASYTGGIPTSEDLLKVFDKELAAALKAGVK